MAHWSLTPLKADGDVVTMIDEPWWVSGTPERSQIFVEDRMTHEIISKTTVAEPAAMAITKEMLARQLGKSLDQLIVLTSFRHLG